MAQIFFNLFVFSLQSYSNLFIFQGICIFVSGLTTLFFVETPFFIYRKGTLGDLQSCLEYMARFNHSKEDSREIIKQISVDLGLSEDSHFPRRLSSNESQNESESDSFDMTLQSTQLSNSFSQQSKDISRNLDIRVESGKNPRRKSLIQEESDIETQFLTNAKAIRLLDLGEYQTVSPSSKSNADKTESLALAQSGTLFDMCRSHNLKNLFCMMFVMSVSYLLYANTIIINQKMGFHLPALNGVLLGISEVFGNLMILMFSHRMGRRTVNTVTNITIFIISIIILIISLLTRDQENQDLNDYEFGRDLVFTGKLIYNFDYEMSILICVDYALHLN